MNRFLRKDWTFFFFFFLKWFTFVLLCLSSIVVRIAPVTAPRQAEEHLAGITIRLCVESMLARGNLRRQDCGESADDSCRRILSLRPHNM